MDGWMVLAKMATLDRRKINGGISTTFLFLFLLPACVCVSTSTTQKKNTISIHHALSNKPFCSLPMSPASHLPQIPPPPAAPLATTLAPSRSRRRGRQEWSFHISFLPFFLFLPSSLLATATAAAQPTISSSSSSSSSCPLNLTVLNKFEPLHDQISQSNNNKCVTIFQYLHFVLSDYVQAYHYFLLPSTSANACWNAFDQKLGSPDAPINTRSLCNVSTLAITRGWHDCHGIQTVNDFEAAVPHTSLSTIRDKCSASLLNTASCSACTKAMVDTASTNLPGKTNGSVNTCQDVVYLYTAGTVNSLGPTDDGTALCLFNIGIHGGSKNNRSKYIYGAIGAVVTLLLVSGVLCFLYYRHRQHKIAKQKDYIKERQEMLDSTMNDNAALRWFTIDEIKTATDNFSRFNIIGKGGFGNVYKGVLPEGTEIAVKRFKNCSPAGDDGFLHEVKVISSVRHRNLVALQGCCLHTSNLEGHQRIIVYELMSNGSLHDHLFTRKTNLDWPTRQNIAIGIVKGLAYLHQDVQPAIIHRDIKASNILLDNKWNARLADFGLAKFTPEGATHVSTRVAGTYGYVAPEYALYGQLTEKSDIYSLGIVLLELFTGRRALVFPTSLDLEQPTLITDWAWTLVKKGSVADVLDPTMENRGHADVMERYVLVALLCSHPQVPYRPSIDQVLKILEDDRPVPAIPDRPIPLTSGLSAIERVTGGSTGILSHSGFQSFSSEGSSKHSNLK